MKYLVLWCAMVLACTSQAQMLFKCVNASGKVEYRGAACESNARAAPMAGGTVSGIDAMSEREIQRAARSSTPVRGPQAIVIGGHADGVVPSDQDIKNMETAASSVTRSKQERDFLRAEVQRAKAARAGSSNYTTDDWKRLKQLQDEQNRLNAPERERARREAEGIHLRAADPVVRQRIEQDAEAEESRVSARRGAAAGGTPPDASFTDRLRHCSSGKCRGERGDTYREVPGRDDTLTRGSDGKRCRVRANGAVDC